MLSINYPIKPSVLLHHHDTENFDHSQLLYIYCDNQRVLHAGRCAALIMIFGSPTSEFYQPRAHNMFSSLSCCNWPLLQQPHQSIRPSKLLRRSYACHYVLVKICIDNLPINSCCPIYMILHQFTAIYDSLKHNHQSFHHVENTVRYHYLSSYPKWICHPTHQ